MFKTSKATEVYAAASRSSSVDGISAIMGRLNASDWLGALLTEMRRALEASSAHEDLVRRSDRQLADIGLSRRDIPSEIYRRYYAD